MNCTGIRCCLQTASNSGRGSRRAPCTCTRRDLRPSPAGSGHAAHSNPATAPGKASAGDQGERSQPRPLRPRRPHRPGSQNYRRHEQISTASWRRRAQICGRIGRKRQLERCYLDGPQYRRSRIIRLLKRIYGDILDEIRTTINPFSKDDPETRVECIVLPIEISDGDLGIYPECTRADRQDPNTVRCVRGPEIRERSSISFQTTPRRGLYHQHRRASEPICHGCWHPGSTPTGSGCKRQLDNRGRCRSDRRLVDSRESCVGPAGPVEGSLRDSGQAKVLPRCRTGSATCRRRNWPNRRLAKR